MRTGWLLSEAKRLWVATAAAVLVAIPLGVLAVENLVLPPEAEPWVVFLVFWTLFTLLHAALSWVTYRGLDHEGLRTALRADATERGLLGRVLRVPGVRSLLGISTAPAFGRQLGLIALLALVAMFLDPALREMPVIRLLAVVLVASSWVNLLVTYTVHYARLHATEDRGLIFPGHGPRTLVDYLYLATAVQTTFGTTDVTVTTRGMRRAVAGHGTSRSCSTR